MYTRHVEWNEWDRKYLEIASRKGCYNPPLTTSFGIFTPEGEEALNYARCIDLKLRVHSRNTGKPKLTSENAQTMSDIVVWGNLSYSAQKLMRHLWDLHPDKVSYNAKLPATITYKTTTVDGVEWILAASLRNNANAWAGFNNLLKFGLIDLKDIRPEDVPKRGRPPVGFALSDTGFRFFEDYMARFDPGTKFQKAINSEKPPTWFMPDYSTENDIKPQIDQEVHEVEDLSDAPGVSEMSEIPDVDNGENLRDIFGG